ncbi:hypothetical protein V8Z74_23655 [Comamonas sp. w2-DMI]
MFAPTAAQYQGKKKRRTDQRGENAQLQLLTAVVQKPDAKIGEQQ